MAEFQARRLTHLAEIMRQGERFRAETDRLRRELDALSRAQRDAWDARRAAYLVNATRTRNIISLASIGVAVFTVSMAAYVGFTPDMQFAVALGCGVAIAMDRLGSLG